MTQTLPPMYTVWASSDVEQRIFIAANAIVCAAILIAIVCRALKMSKSTTRRGVIFFYVFTAMAAVANGLSYYLFEEIPGPGSLASSIAILLYLIVSARNWRTGQPSTARKEQPPWNT